MQINQPQSPYRLIAQNRNDELIFEIVGQPYHIIKTAREAFADSQFLSGLPATHVALIGFIVGMSTK